VTTAELLRTDIPVAGVPWPVHKLVALAVGVVTLALIGLLSGAAAPAVLSAAAVTAAVWAALAALRAAGRHGGPATRS